ncbi:MAG TPA: hypothetical protein VN201_00925 [Roseateles sp.]|nr:hypothetical protein [Roseateles sp.]
MSAFTPCKGDLFYIRFKPIKRVINDGPFSGGTVEARVIEQQDGSYSGDVFECVGRDDHAIAGKARHGCGWRGDIPITFVRSECVFSPVGPEIAQALGLVQQTDAA